MTDYQELFWVGIGLGIFGLLLGLLAFCAVLTAIDLEDVTK